MNAPTKDTEVRLQLRLPGDLADFLRQAARESRRSLNSEMLVRLEQSRDLQPVKGESQ